MGLQAEGEEEEEVADPSRRKTGPEVAAAAAAAEAEEDGKCLRLWSAWQAPWTFCRWGEGGRGCVGGMGAA